MPTLINKKTEQVVVLDSIGSFFEDIQDPENWVDTASPATEEVIEPPTQEDQNKIEDGSDGN